MPLFTIGARARRLSALVLTFAALAAAAFACGSSTAAPGGVASNDAGGGSSRDGGTSLGALDAGRSDAASPTGFDSGTEGDANAVDAGPPFDASGLTVVDVTNDAGLAYCPLSTDDRYLVVTIQNQGTTTTFATAVRVATTGSTYTLVVPTPTLAAGASAQVQFDRGPLVGFVADWQFTVTIDPQGEHGAPHAPVPGECHDLRSRAAAGMPPLAAFYDPDAGLWGAGSWWTSANQLETVIDYSRETGDTTYTSQIATTYDLNDSNNFDKFGYYDDDGWWALALVKAYDLTHQAQYLAMAKTIFTRMIGGWDTVCNGGLYWASAEAGANGRANKNAIPNELFLTLAARLHLRTPGDSGSGSYLDWAQKEWAWFSQTGMIQSNGQIVDGLASLTACNASGPVFTYNQGVILGGLVDLAASTGDTTLLDQANTIAHATMKNMSNASGVLVETPCGGDICAQFKGIFMRNLAYLYEAAPLPEYQAYMIRQSDDLWNTSVRNGQNQFGYAWESAFDSANPSHQSSALDALIAAVRAANMNVALFGTASSADPSCSGTEVPSLAIDGASNWDSKWCSGGAGGQALEVDLGASREIVGFRVRHAGAGGEDSSYDTRDFEIATSPDGTTWTTVVTVAGNTSDVTTHPIPAVEARFVQLHVTTAQTATTLLAARIYEFETYGITW